MNIKQKRTAVEARATSLDCVVVEMTNKRVICRRHRDNTFITWCYHMQQGKAVFYWGHYDMDLKDAVVDYQSRCNS